MADQPVLSFKAGECEGDTDSQGPCKVQPVATKGYIYLYHDEDLLRFCWRARDQTLDNPKHDLFIVPYDATFKPYLSKGAPVKQSPVAGRVFVLKFRSSSTRHFFWLQSEAEDPSQPSFFSKGDLKLGELVDRLLQGEDPESIGYDLARLRRGRHDGPYNLDSDTVMQDSEQAADGPSSNNDERRGSGGAGPDATGGDFRDEGEDSREGGGDGARAALPDDANSAIQNFLKSLDGGVSSAQQQQAHAGGQGGGGASEDPFTTLVDLLPSSTTIPVLATLPDAFVTELLVRHLPSSLLYLAHGMDPAEIPDESASDQEAVAALADALEPEQRRDLLRRVLRSPQLHQALQQMTQALRDGGLPAVAGAVGVDVEAKGYVNERAGIPMNGGRAVRVFLEGIKKAVEDEDKGKET